MSTASPAAPQLERVLAGAQLPALPQSAIRVLELSQDEKNGPTEFAMPIEADPGLTSQVLKFVNSSYFGFTREISSIKLAITMVGIRTIKNFALWSAVFSIMPNPKCGAFDLKSLWQDSLLRALFARALCRQLGLRDSEDAFAAALLQDMAVPMLAKELSGQYAEMFERRDGGRVRLSQLERECFGFTHGEAAAHLATRWNLPEEFGRLIRQHSEIEELLASGPANTSQVAVAASALLPAVSDEQWHDAANFEAVYRRMCPQGAPLTAFLDKIDQEFGEFAPVLKIATPAKTLAGRFREATQLTDG